MIDAVKAVNRKGVPYCPHCGGNRISVGGFTTFKWKRGGWVRERGSEEVADSSIPICCGCGGKINMDDWPLSPSLQEGA